MGFLMVAIGIATYVGIRRLDYRELRIFKQGTLLPIFSLPVVNHSIFRVFSDMAFIGLAYIGAFLIRYEDVPFQSIKLKIFQTFPLILAIKVATFYLLGLYRRAWRYTSIADFICIAQAIFFSSFFSFIISRFVFTLPINFTIFIIDFLLLSVLVGGSRISFRVLDYFQRVDQKVGEKTPIYGAGTGGSFALNEFLNNPSLHLIPIGFLDDAPDKVGKLVHGYPVLGTLKGLPAILENHHPSQIIISSAKIPPEKAQALKSICEERGIRAKRFRIEFQDI